LAGHVRVGRDDQAEVVAFLGDPASYPTRPDRIERFETRGALVFLAGEEAWKIKRAVRFPYMDFSTLEKRKAVCQREVAINRRFAPEIYLGCTPVTRRSDGRLELGGDGEIVEWVVHMRRFEQAALLSLVAKAGHRGGERRQRRCATQRSVAAKAPASSLSDRGSTKSTLISLAC
jgi:hypothetical protein